MGRLHRDGLFRSLYYCNCGNPEDPVKASHQKRTSSQPYQPLQTPEGAQYIPHSSEALLGARNG
jgi:hypothetical protein